MKKSVVLLLGFSFVMAIAAMQRATRHTTALAEEPSAANRSRPDVAATNRARKQIQMLDNIYKQTIVLITDKYVHDEDDFAAGSAAVLLFENVSKSGSHQVRLLDATGEPYDPDNVARDDFEREGVKRLKAGADKHEQIQWVDGKPRLRVLTPVPVVMQKCVMCHDHYGAVKDGEPIGAISYTIAIE